MTTDKKLKFIFLSVCKKYDISKEDIISRTRRRPIVEKRQILFYLCKKHTNATLYRIGEVFMGAKEKRFDHATVLHAVKTIENLMQIDKNLSLNVSQLESMITRKFVKDRSKSFINLKFNVIKAVRLSKNEEILINELMMLL